MKPENDVIIIGGGLSGLALAYFLQKKGIAATVLEGAERLGGRIHTAAGALGTPLELGATWFSDMHPQLLSLIEELGLKKYPQFSEGISLFQTKSFEPAQQFFVPAAEAPSYRLAGGTGMLIKALSEKLPAGAIKLNAKVVAVREAGNSLTAETAGGNFYTGKAIISCIPPQLVASQVAILPELPQFVLDVLPNVQTWMAGAIKFALEYAQPFWRTKGFSGMLYSHAGIIVEMYDHTNFEENRFGFTGFLNNGAASYAPEVRRELVLRQLSELMGSGIPLPVAYYDKVWNNEFIIHGTPVILRPHQDNGHPVLRSSYMNGKFHFCGTETATACPGYMEGAVVAAKFIADRL